MSNKRLHLDRFAPYRLSVLANKVSSAVARRYSHHFDLTIPEWRVLAVLGEHPGLSARDVAAHTAMDKVQVSRAVASLIAAKRIARTPDKTDGRVGHLELTRKGRTTYEQLVPLALQMEQQFLTVLSTGEMKMLDRLLTKLTDQADRFSDGIEPDR